MGYIVDTTGTIKKVNPNNGTEFTLKELQGFVGGLIENVPIFFDQVSEKPEWDVMLCNEEGLIKGYEPNEIASRLAQQLIVGNVVLLKNEEWS
tara:strand:- start:3059 stop:3337 length:279 start_codon:yes stop_codon:yes gene_type:complete